MKEKSTKICIDIPEALVGNILRNFDKYNVGGFIVKRGMEHEFIRAIIVHHINVLDEYPGSIDHYLMDNINTNEHGVFYSLVKSGVVRKKT